MRIYLTVKIVLVLALLASANSSGTADDDEVDTSVPGYPHKIYSGIVYLMQGLSSSTSSRIKLSTTSSSPPKAISPAIRFSSGSPELLAAHPSSHASMKMGPSSSTPARSPSLSTITPGIKKQTSSSWNCPPGLAFPEEMMKLSRTSPSP